MFISNRKLKRPQIISQEILHMKHKILYVDDEPINLKLFEINLRKKYNVITCSSGQEGLEQLEKNKDIMFVLSDLKMPEMNGLEFVRKAKSLYDEKSFYLLTGFDMSDEILNAIENGTIVNYFGKPFEFKDIEATLDKAISKL